MDDLTVFGLIVLAVIIVLVLIVLPFAVRDAPGEWREWRARRRPPIEPEPRTLDRRSSRVREVERITGAIEIIAPSKALPLVVEASHLRLPKGDGS